MSINHLTTTLMLAATAALAWPFLVPAGKPSPPAAAPVAIPATPLAVRGASTGRLDAPVVVLEFSDFECPFCGKFARETLPEVKRRYVDSGKVRFVFNHYPLERLHPLAMRAAVLAECARRQDAFWTVHDALFASPQMVTRLLENPGDVGSLDQKTLSACRSSDEAAASVMADREVARTLGLSGTPALLIGAPAGNNLMKVQKVLFGAVTVDTFADAVESVERGRSEPKS